MIPELERKRKEEMSSNKLYWIEVWWCSGAASTILFKAVQKTGESCGFEVFHGKFPTLMNLWFFNCGWIFWAVAFLYGCGWIFCRNPLRHFFCTPGGSRYVKPLLMRYSDVQLLDIQIWYNLLLLTADRLIATTSGIHPIPGIACDFDQWFVFYPKNHGTSKLVVWRSQNPAKNRSNPLFFVGSNRWCLGLANIMTWNPAE